MAKRESDTSNFRQIFAGIKKDEFRPIYFLSGEEIYFIDQISNYIEKNALTESERAFNQLVLYGKEVAPIQVVDNARQFPMMAKKRVVILKEAQEMKDFDTLEGYVNNPSPDTILVINYMHKNIDKRTNIAKALKKNSQFLEFDKLYESQVPTWAIAYLSDQGKELDRQSAQLIAEYLGNDLKKVVNELDKLVLNVVERKKILPEDIEKNIGISKDYNSFELAKALATKDRVKAFRIINYFNANPKNNPIQKTNAALFSYFKKVLIAQKNNRLDDRALGSLLKVSHYFVSEYRTASRNYPRKKLESIFEKILDTDMRSKGLNNHRVSHDELLQELTLHIFN